MVIWTRFFVPILIIGLIYVITNSLLLENDKTVYSFLIGKYLNNNESQISITQIYNHIVISNIPFGVSEEALKKIFSKYTRNFSRFKESFQNRYGNFQDLRNSFKILKMFLNHS